ncbi:hypothetical protein J2741_002608 [Methanolinea mesophila]|uniref:hypothetical protein n=1 Tax=Methanolinea mesophila TaxID=547055 RepID=UPI001AE6EC55|nr:hypothetical protein [Methanolinea mesophila]MBP1930012.1 hypothetical protein [Methanolinea mesophila]
MSPAAITPDSPVGVDGTGENENPGSRVSGGSSGGDAAPGIMHAPLIEMTNRMNKRNLILPSLLMYSPTRAKPVPAAYQGNIRFFHILILVSPSKFLLA